MEKEDGVRLQAEEVIQKAASWRTLLGLAWFGGALPSSSTFKCALGTLRGHQCNLATRPSAITFTLYGNKATNAGVAVLEH